jgi:pimeloyl-ACP methyl ester carboxylesterase/DNA-binding SARP family transcriptional activator
MDPAEGSVEVRMLGPLALRAEGLVLGPRDFGAVKPKQLLELLLLERGRLVPKERMGEALWGERLPRRGAATIESYVSVLRRRLDARPGLGRRLIVTEPGGYRLATEALDVDLDAFEALLRRAAASGGAERRAALDAAVALGEADLLDDEPYAAWVLPLRAHYRERQVQALVELAECCEALGDQAAALAAAERALRREPTRERACRAALRAHRASGDRDGALRAYERCRQALAAELGVGPTAETAALHAAILDDEAPPAPAAAPGGRTPPVPVLPGGPTPPGRPIAYARHGAVRIAYQVVGTGPPDLVFSPSNVSNLAATWDDPTYAAFLRALAGMGRLILFDKRGTGLSDPALDFPTTRERSEDLVRVLDAAGSERAVLFGVCGGGALCAQLAADHPERVAGLILHNAMARMLAAADYPWGWPPERYARLLDGFEQAWLGNGDGLVRRNPGLADNPRYRDWFARYVRLGASPWMARRLSELNATLDVRDALARIRAPTLVICRRDDVWLSPENSRYLAERIPRAQLLELPGVDHDPWVGDAAEVLSAVRDFLAGAARRAIP